MKRSIWLGLIGWIALFEVTHASAQLSAPLKHGSVVTEHFTSEILRENLIGIDPKRSLSVYLPPGYQDGQKSYPVIYYFHTINWSNQRMFAEGASAQTLFDRAISQGTMREFILVAADYTTPTLGTFYGNAPSSGRWLDYTIHEVVPYVDEHFRTLRQPDSRGLAGDFLGAYMALKLAMLYPDLFSSVYALHPVGTGTGLMPTQSMVDWRRIHQAKSFADLAGDPYAPAFVAIAQAYLPNPDRPPFYCDFMVEMENGEPMLNVENVKKVETRFHLDELLRTHGENLRKMRGIAFDWGRYDPTQSHVFSNQAFTRKLDQLGIEHCGEEYNGGPWEKNWIEHGRVEDRMLPFFNRLLVFEETAAVASEAGDHKPKYISP